MHFTKVFVLASMFGLVMSLSVPFAWLTGAQTGTPEAAWPGTTEAENEAVARRWHEEAINEANLDVIDEIVTEGVIHHAGTFPDGEGPEAVSYVLGALLAGFPDVRHTIEQVVSSGDFVVIRFQAAGTHEGEFQGIAPTGNRATWSGINMFRFECGLIAEEWSEVDGLGRLVQFEAEASPTP